MHFSAFRRAAAQDGETGPMRGRTASRGIVMNYNSCITKQGNGRLRLRMRVSVYRDDRMFNMACHCSSAERIACARYNPFRDGYGHHLQLLQRHNLAYLKSRFPALLFKVHCV